MNAHIQHLHYHAQLAELRGFTEFAKYIRAELVKVLLELKGAEFFDALLPVAENGHHIPASVAPYFDDNSYLKKLTALGCDCGNPKFYLREIPPPQ